MSEIKYTNDGRKVLVVGKLNAKQSIVQEIFVSDGNEIPSGENFVVGSLHEAPAESWKEKRLRELEERYDRTRVELERRIEKARQSLSEAETKAKLRASALLAFAKNSDDEQLQRLHAFLAGEVTHFFINGYPPKIISFDDDTVFDVDRWGGSKKIDGIKLVSLVGRSGGNLAYRLSDYRDGSGGSTEVIPCRSYAEAAAEAQKVLDVLAADYVSGTVGYLDLSRWEKIEGIAIPGDAMEKFNAEKRKAANDQIERLKSQIAELEAKAA